MSKIVCVYHSIDLDGFMSAAIVKHWHESIMKSQENITGQSQRQYHEINFIGYNYGQPIPDLSEYDKVIMCDISFPKEEMEKLNNHNIFNPSPIYIDHHISAINDLGINCENSFATKYEGIQDTKYAACELTWKYFFPNNPMPEIVRFLGMYDSFRHKGTNEEQSVLEFQYGARQCISNYEEAYHFLKLSLDDRLTVVRDIYLSGVSIYKYLCTEAKQAYKNGFEIEFMIPHPEYIGEGQYKLLKFICINKERFNPINFGIDYHLDGYDGCACFHFDGIHWCFSLYNDNGKVDCSIIAKQFGGGGHRGASGFRCDNETFLNIISTR